MPAWWQEVRYGMRSLAKSPGTTLIIVLALALGIGANTACFTFVHAIILRPFPFPELDRIVTAYESELSSVTPDDGVSPANYLDWRERARSYESMGAIQGWDVNLTGTSVPERLDGYSVSASLFRTLGMRPALGRTFAAAEEQPGRNRVVVVSYGFWQSQLAGDPRVCGQTVLLNGEAHTVVGVMPREFDYPLGAAVWRPLALTDAERAQRDVRSLAVRARLKPGVPLDQARAESAAIFAQLEREYPAVNRGRTVSVRTLRESANFGSDRFVLTLLAAAGFVLLLACANVANLQLARAVGRVREMALRSALGASRWRVARQFLAESLILSALGGVFAVLLAVWDVDLMHATVPAQVYRWVAGLRDIQVNGAALAVTGLVSALAAVLCSLGPALYCSRRDALGEALKEGGRGGSAALARHPFRKLLVASEIALALTLLIGAGVMVKTFDHMTHRDLGFQTANAMRMSVALNKNSYRSGEQVRGYTVRTLEALRAIPGVKAAGGTAWIAAHEPVRVEGRPEPDPGAPTTHLHAVSSGYFKAMGAPLLQGRAIDERDNEGAQRVAVVSQSVARSYWPDGNPVGRRIRVGGSEWLTVVGVAGDERDWFTGAAYLDVYASQLQSPERGLTFVLRSSGDPAGLAAPARAAALGVDPAQPVYNVITLEQALSDQTSGVRSAAQMMTGFAAIALVLAASGIYALIAYQVAQRRREIGVRMALGASPAVVSRQVVAQAAKLAALGLGVGLPLAIGMMWSMSRALYDVTPVEWTTFAACTAALAAAALLAGYIPARRAARIDPVVALRCE